MRNPFHTPFAAIFCNELLLNTKRVAPYVLMLLFSANAVLWWGWGPAVERGWATNSDFYIQRNVGGFSFILGLPIFTAIIMGDPVIRDFRQGVYPLIFSKPVGRLSYLLGKFCGNFFVLVCCQSVFAITLFLLQWVPFSGMVTLEFRVVPYIKLFFFTVVITHLVLAAFYFVAGTLTRNAKVVYGLAACFYPAIIAYAEVLKAVPAWLRVFIDPFGFNFQARIDPWTSSADFLNHYVVSYSLSVYVNRATMIVVSAVCLLILYFRFTIAERPQKSDELTILSLTRAPEKVPYRLEVEPTPAVLLDSEESHASDRVKLPKVTRTQQSTCAKILAALSVEFRLLRDERSLIVLTPLAIFLSTVELAFYRVVPDVSYSATYATGTANALLIFLAVMIVFYTGEAMHRDRELRIEPVIWATPIPNCVLLLSKWLAMVLVTLSLVLMVGLTAIVIQLLRGHTPIDVSAYLITYGVIVFPSIVFVTALVMALNVILRNKYLAYVAAAGTGASLFYLYSVGYKHWLYNPLLFQLWKYPDLTGAAVLMYRLYCLTLTVMSLAVAHLFFQRKSGVALREGR
jgi:ABC-type transport system involved in multi-copper enzyme maturation permease subunit